MTYPTLDQMYPDIADLFTHPTFNQPHGRSDTHFRKLNDWCNFWNLLGARSLSMGNHCSRCGARYSKKGRKNKIDQLCTRCLVSKLAKQRRLKAC